MSMILGDCLEVLKGMADNSVDSIVTDPPYGLTNNKWDTEIDLDKMWKQFKRITKCNIIITASEPFASKLIMSNPSMFKYDLIWVKPISSGQLNIKTQPLRSHEHILVFYNKFSYYNEIKTKGKPYKKHRTDRIKSDGYMQQKASDKDNSGYRHAKSVINIPNQRIKNGHPTQKPVELMRYLIRTYVPPNGIVLDPFAGSGSTGMASYLEGKEFIGIEREEEYFNIANKRIASCRKQPTLFDV